MVNVAYSVAQTISRKTVFKRLGLALTMALLITGCNLFICGCGVPADHIDLGGIQTVSVGATVTLEAKQIISYNGNRAFDLTGACLVWTFESKPTASQAGLEQSCKSLKATFIPDAAGDYRVRAEIIYDDGHKDVHGQVSVTANSLSSSQSER
jgi:hypothetical protein